MLVYCLLKITPKEYMRESGFEYSNNYCPITTSRVEALATPHTKPLYYSRN